MANKRNYSGRKSPVKQGYKNFQTWLTPSEKFKASALLYFKKMTVKEWVNSNVNTQLNDLADKKGATITELFEEYKKHLEKSKKKTSVESDDINIYNL